MSAKFPRWQAAGRVRLLLAVLALVPIVAACGSQTESLTGTARDAVLAYSEAKTTNLLSGMDAADYATFSRDLSDKMKQAIPADGLAKLRTQVTDKIGKYRSRQLDSVVRQGEFITVIYLARFETDDKVTVRVTFDALEPHLIGGLWFDSETLRK